MKLNKVELAQTIGEVQYTCLTIKAILSILKDYCEDHDDKNKNVFYIWVLIDILLSQHLNLTEQIDLLESLTYKSILS